MEDGSPEVDPADEVEVVGRVGLALDDPVDGLVEHGDGACAACTERSTM